MHHRTAPADHRFTTPVTHVWLDPDHPEALFDRHPLWSSSHPSPIRFRRRDYLDGDGQPLGPAIRRRLAEPLGRTPDGPLRMLTQPRTWGWLFNPITVYLAWDAEPDARSGSHPGPDAGPVAALLEVTNTPWKERHLYPVALEPVADAPNRFRASFDKVLHVSPFLDEAFTYQLELWATDPARDARSARRFTLSLDVIDHRPDRRPDPASRIQEPPRIQEPSRIQERDHDEQHDDPTDSPDAAAGRVVLTTRLVVDQHPVERRVLTQALVRNPLPTHRVSFGIHRQALSLWRKRVPFVSHPRRRSGAANPSPTQP